jgi:hypothetical protein
MPVFSKDPVVISNETDPVRRTKTEIADYLRHAIADSVQRGKDDARIIHTHGVEVRPLGKKSKID